MAEKISDKTFFKRLNKLFSTSVVVNRPGKGRKVLDIDKLQSYASLETNRVVIDRYTRAGKSQYYNSLLGYSPTLSGYYINRNSLYREYEQMEADPIIASALDIYSDDSTKRNEFGDILTISSPKEEIEESLHSLFYDVLNIEFNLWMWIRTLCKYGDFYLKLDITEEIGITNVIPISSYAINRQEDPTQPNLVLFVIDPGQLGSTYGFQHNTSDSNKFYFENYEIAHFRLLADSNYLPYGRSMLENGRKVWKQLMMMEDAMMIHRIMRAPEKRVFKIDIGNIPPNEVDVYMNGIIDKLKKVPYIDPSTGQYNLEFNLMNMLEDFYLPVRGGNSGTEIQPLTGMEWTGVEDIKFLQNKLFASLKIPKAFLSYEEDVNAKATLSAEDSRFAGTIERIQKIVISELTKIAIVHLYSQGFSDADLVDFTLGLTLSSKEYESEMIEMWTKKVSLARDLKELNLVPNEFIYENIFHINADQAEEYKEKIVNDLKMKYRLAQIGEQGQDPAKQPNKPSVPGQPGQEPTEQQPSSEEKTEPKDTDEGTFLDEKNLLMD